MSNRPMTNTNLSCPRCTVSLRYAGTQKFHEGTRAWDFLGGFWELCKNRVRLDMYVCPSRGRVEFFADGIGDELGGEEPT